MEGGDPSAETFASPQGYHILKIVNAAVGRAGNEHAALREGGTPWLTFLRPQKSACKRAKSSW
jgi:hypothetical protein